MNYSQRKACDKEVNELLAAGFIEQCNDPSINAAPTFMLQKKVPVNAAADYKPEYRLVNAFTEFNNNTENYVEVTGDTYTPILKTMTNDSRYFSIYDIRDAYHHILTSETIQKYLRFITYDNKIYKWKRMCFGMKQAPSIWNQFIRLILPKEFHSFFDDVFSGSRDIDHWEKQFEDLLKACYKNNLTLRLSKCEFFCPTIEVLGHKISYNKIEPSAKTKNNVIEIKSPTSVHELKVACGIINYCYKFIPALHQYMSKFSKLLRKNVEFIWTVEHQKALDSVKKIIENNPFVIPPDYDKQFIITTDGSGTGIGCVLEQEVNGIRYPVEFSSKVL